MENIRIRCRSCGKEVIGCAGKTYSCGCENMTTVRGNSISARDMSKVVMVNTPRFSEKIGFTEQDMQWQEKRRQRKIRKLDFEVR
tara:strand:+ start:596 stop:850 length:255 start_codon:yes stop_codon:yes gene_type:complete